MAHSGCSPGTLTGIADPFAYLMPELPERQWIESLPTCL
jgi:hypothetical protein